MSEHTHLEKARAHLRAYRTELRQALDSEPLPEALRVEVEVKRAALLAEVAEVTRWAQRAREHHETLRARHQAEGAP